MQTNTHTQDDYRLPLGLYPPSTNSICGNLTTEHYSKIQYIWPDDIIPHPTTDYIVKKIPKIDEIPLISIRLDVT